MELKIEYLPVDQLTPYEHNARKHQDIDVDAIAASIKEFEFDDPIGIWGKDNIIVEGHGRLMAAQKLGMDTVPVIRLDHLSDEQRRAYALAHNRTAELSEWDEMVKAMEVQGIKELDMSLFGFAGDGIEESDNAEIEEDEPPEPPEEPTAKRGDIYQLGQHRLMCGDSTSLEEVEKLINGDEIDLLLTDPPYNCNVGNCERPHSSNSGVGIMNDHMEESDFIQFLSHALMNAEQKMRGGVRRITSGTQGCIIWSLRAHCGPY